MTSGLILTLGARSLSPATSNARWMSVLCSIRLEAAVVISLTKGRRARSVRV